MKNKIIVLLSAILFCMTLGLKDAMAAAASDVACKAPCINSFEIEDGQITATDIANNAVTNAKIADGAVTTTKITDGSVTNTKIGDGSVTDAKITGPISSSKIEKPAKIAVVAQSGGNYTDPVTAMNNLSAWCGTPSATNPCLLKIMPGVYNIGANSLQMQNYVDIEGSGEDVTKITGNAGTIYTAVVNGASNAEIRFLTVENTGAANEICAIYNVNPSAKITNVTVITTGGAASNSCGVWNDASVTMTNVTVSATGGINTNRGVVNQATVIMTNVIITATGGGFQNIGVLNSFSTVTMTNATVNVSGSGAIEYIGVLNMGNSNVTIMNSTITATGGVSKGVSNNASFATITNSTITASGGSGIYTIDNFGGSLKIDHSVIGGSNSTIIGSYVYVGNTRLDGGPVSGTVICAGVYDENYVFYPNTCP
ncbi:MAG: hypothetical protein A3G39_09360 [Deltaproteobacteria bacterium RIFCSPLOWO2_12_FULL_43_16]|nr:MAG: hypothetical protein A3D30_06420 [Deltaproteobacteria bacterium RIFCSPHIGHO2_02_FULL_43_33]OGQ58665.1 MAG: hypothetical protein A3G39_09360 [Deltaproteobacteria bacterium RIFCSPLOWO2_12_FULL_43_16]